MTEKLFEVLIFPLYTLHEGYYVWEHVHNVYVLHVLFIYSYVSISKPYLFLSVSPLKHNTYKRSHFHTNFNKQALSNVYVLLTCHKNMIDLSRHGLCVFFSFFLFILECGFRLFSLLRFFVSLFFCNIYFCCCCCILFLHAQDYKHIIVRKERYECVRRGCS